MTVLASSTDAARAKLTKARRQAELAQHVAPDVAADVAALLAEADVLLADDTDYGERDGTRYREVRNRYFFTHEPIIVHLALDALMTALSAKYERAQARHEAAQVEAAARRARAEGFIQEALRFEFQGNRTQAKNCALFATEADALCAFAWFTLGRLLEAEDALRPAFDAYARAATLDPTCAAAAAAEAVREEMEDRETVDAGDLEEEDWLLITAPRYMRPA